MKKKLNKGIIFKTFYVGTPFGCILSLFLSYIQLSLLQIGINNNKSCRGSLWSSGFCIGSVTRRSAVQTLAPVLYFFGKKSNFQIFKFSEFHRHSSSFVNTFKGHILTSQSLYGLCIHQIGVLNTKNLICVQL